MVLAWSSWKASQQQRMSFRHAKNIFLVLDGDARHSTRTSVSRQECIPPFRRANVPEYVLSLFLRQEREVRLLFPRNKCMLRPFLPLNSAGSKSDACKPLKVLNSLPLSSTLAATVSNLPYTSSINLSYTACGTSYMLN